MKFKEFTDENLRYNGQQLETDDGPVAIAVGAHAAREDGVCVMEAVAWFAGEAHGDKPRCCCPVIASFLRSWNDCILDDETRTRLLAPLVHVVVGTRSTPAVEERRSWMALDWLVRDHAPTWMELTPALADHAKQLRGLPELNQPQTWPTAEPVLAAAWNAAWAAAAKAAAKAAAEDTAARTTARATAMEAARAAGMDAAWAAAGNAAGNAARAAAWNAAKASAWAALQPTVETLQLSARDLVMRMAAL